MANEDPGGSTHGRRGFATTRWSVVVAAGSAPSAESRAALQIALDLGLRLDSRRKLRWL